MPEHLSNRIGKIRIRGAEGNTPALRLSVGGVLERADLRPVGFPPSAVLVVRRMSDPLPGGVNRRGGGAAINGQWERAVQAELAQISASAVRPQAGNIHDNGQAVLFADEAEMLACLVLDISRGEANARWWWHSFLARMPGERSSALREALCRQPQSIAASLNTLDEWGRVGIVLRVMSPQDATRVLSVVIQAHALPDFRRASGLPWAETRFAESKWRQNPVGESAAMPTDPLDRGRAASSPGGPTQDGGWPGPRLRPQGLSKEASALLAVALATHRNPAIARNDRFQRAMSVWWLSQDASAGTAPEAGVEMADRERAPLPPPTNVGEKTTAIRQPVPPRITHKGAARQEGEAPRAPDTHLTTDAAEIDSGNHRKPSQASNATRPASQRGQHVPDAGPAGGKVEQPEQAERSEVEKKRVQLALENGVLTRLGGVLYLANLMCRLDLPECFEDSWGLGSRVGSWGVLAGLGEALLAWDDPTVWALLANDPLWKALAHLGNSADEGGPIHNGKTQPDFRLPPSWIGETEGDQNRAAFRWARRGGRLRAWSPAGIVLIDIAERGRYPESTALDELHAYGLRGAVFLLRASFSAASVAPLTPPLAEMHPLLARWLALALPAIRSYLLRALSKGGMADPSVESVFRCAGRLYVTSTHVDLVMPLDAISLPARMAGLDRDPGWLGGFGRVIKFHFE